MNGAILLQFFEEPLANLLVVILLAGLGIWALAYFLWGTITLALSRRRSSSDVYTVVLVEPEPPAAAAEPELVGRHAAPTSGASQRTGGPR